MLMIFAKNNQHMIKLYTGAQGPETTASIENLMLDHELPESPVALQKNMLCNYVGFLAGRLDGVEGKDVELLATYFNRVKIIMAVKEQRREFLDKRPKYVLSIIEETP